MSNPLPTTLSATPLRISQYTFDAVPIGVYHLSHSPSPSLSSSPPTITSFLLAIYSPHFQQFQPCCTLLTSSIPNHLQQPLCRSLTVPAVGGARTGGADTVSTTADIPTDTPPNIQLEGFSPDQWILPTEVWTVTGIRPCIRPSSTAASEFLACNKKNHGRSGISFWSTQFVDGKYSGHDISKFVTTGETLHHWFLSNYYYQ